MNRTCVSCENDTEANNEQSFKRLFNLELISFCEHFHANNSQSDVKILCTYKIRGILFTVRNLCVCTSQVGTMAQSLKP